MKTTIALATALALAAAPAAAQRGDQHSVSLRNDTGTTVNCGMKRDGSSGVEWMTIKTGAVWTKQYSGGKNRRVMCQGQYSIWHPIAADASYRLVQPSRDRIVVVSQ